MTYDEMTPEQQAAYDAARAEIAQAKADGANILSLWGMAVLPPEIADLTELLRLDLLDVQLTDITPLAGLSGLKMLDLDDSQVSDLGPLQGLTQLESLFLRNAPVSDLRPLRKLPRLARLDLQGTLVQDLRPLLDVRALWEKAGRSIFDGLPGTLHFPYCAATSADPTLAKLSQITDHKERADITRAYLQSLPPYPEPLPWLEKAQPDLSSKEPDSADHPGAKPAPLMVRMTAEGELRSDPPGDDLEAAQQQRAAQAWEALRHYLSDLVPLRERVSNRMPNLANAMASLERALGPDFATMNQIDLGLQADRVQRLSAEAETYLLDQDPAELAGFVAALGLYMRRFTEWEKYKDDPPPPPETAERLREDRDVLEGLASEGKTGPEVLETLSDLIEGATAEGATALDVRGFLDSESNVLDQLSEALIDLKEHLPDEEPEYWEALHAESGEAFRGKLMETLPVSGSVWVVSYFLRFRGPLHGWPRGTRTRSGSWPGCCV